jgi:predicted lipid-binding transport protein (Tim44 family)
MCHTVRNAAARSVKRWASAQNVEPHLRSNRSPPKQSQEPTEEVKRQKRARKRRRQNGFIGPLIGGLILIVLGLTAYLRVSGVVTDERYIWAFFLVLIGLVIIVAAVYTLIMAARRHPKT